MPFLKCKENKTTEKAPRLPIPFARCHSDRARGDPVYCDHVDYHFSCLLLITSITQLHRRMRWLGGKVSTTEG